MWAIEVFPGHKVAYRGGVVSFCLRLYYFSCSYS